MDHAAAATTHGSHADHGHGHGGDGHGHDHDHSFDAEMEMVSKGNWPPVGLAKFCIWLFLATEVMFFAGLIGSYFVLRLGNPQWPDPSTVLSVPLTAMNTFILICSSVTMVKALEYAQAGDAGKMKLFLLATWVIGGLFLGVQVFEYWELGWGRQFDPSTQGAMPTQTCVCAAGHKVKEFAGPHFHFAPQANIFASTFYIMTGCHGAHVAGGVITIFIIWVGAMLGKVSPTNWGPIEMSGLYWHFVDLVWILLFTVVYLM